jgi:hypothetical protein
MCNLWHHSSTCWRRSVFGRSISRKRITQRTTIKYDWPYIIYYILSLYYTSNIRQNKHVIVLLNHTSTHFGPSILNIRSSAVNHSSLSKIYDIYAIVDFHVKIWFIFLKVDITSPPPSHRGIIWSRNLLKVYD